MKKLSVMFIGNSYTYYNDMPKEIFTQIAAAAGYETHIAQFTLPNWELIRAADPEDEQLGAMIDRELRDTKYDFVVLQEQSTNPAVNRGDFYEGVRRLSERIKKNGATAVLYSTWGRKDGNEFLEESGLTGESMTLLIAAAYEAIAAELEMEVAHVGYAFREVYLKDVDGLDIYHEDLTHPSVSGSYLAAMTIFAKLTGMDPITVDQSCSLPEAHTRIMKEAARRAVFETPSLPEEYVTDSKKL